jgi:RNA polymerase sigma-70 factor (ECF subfamily)
MRPSPPPSEPDDALVARARAGDDEAFAALCRRHEARLRALVGRRLGPAVQRKVSVADVLQETWIVAHHGLGAFEPRHGGAVAAWLARIAVHKAQEAVRHHAGAARRAVGREVSRPDRPVTGDVPGSVASPSRRAGDREDRERLHAALARLPRRQREVLQLVQLNGLGLEATAVLLARSKEAVRKLYGRALQRLGALLEEADAEDVR